MKWKGHKDKKIGGFLNCKELWILSNYNEQLGKRLL